MWTDEDSRYVYRLVADAWPGELPEAAWLVYREALGGFSREVVTRAVVAFAVHQLEPWRPPAGLLARRCREIADPAYRERMERARVEGHSPAGPPPEDPISMDEAKAMLARSPLRRKPGGAP